MIASLLTALARSAGTVIREPYSVTACTSSPTRPATLATMRLDLPRKLATNVVFGFSYSSVGEPICSTRPEFITAMVSAMVMASSWSWVTCTKVRPTSVWIRFELDLHLAAQLEVERAEPADVEQQHLRVVDQRAGQGDALLLPAGQLRRLARGQAAELDEGQDRRRRASSHILDAAPAQPEGDVLEDVQVRERARS